VPARPADHRFGDRFDPVLEGVALRWRSSAAGGGEPRSARSRHRVRGWRSAGPPAPGVGPRSLSFPLLGGLGTPAAGPPCRAGSGFERARWRRGLGSWRAGPTDPRRKPVRSTPHPPAGWSGIERVARKKSLDGLGEISPPPRNTGESRWRPRYSSFLESTARSAPRPHRR